MTKELIIEQVTPEGVRDIARLTSGQAVVGREPSVEGESITIASHAVSRAHGEFLKLKSHWFYRDLGSTNGSWCNGKQLAPGQLHLVRPGDMIQLADISLRLRSEEPRSASGVPEFSTSSLIVLCGTGLDLKEFQIPEYGRALVIGGAQGNLPLSGSDHDLPRLVVERRGEKVCAFGVSEGLSITHNQTELIDTAELIDGDELKVGEYTVLFNDPRIARERRIRGSAGPIEASGVGTRVTLGGGQSKSTAPLRDWTPGSEGDPLRTDEHNHGRSSSQRLLFGRGTPLGAPGDEGDADGTVAIDPADLEARLAELDPRAIRFNGVNKLGTPLLQASEDKVIVIVGFVLLLGLILTVAAWLLV